MSARRILVVDDEAGIRQALGQLLEYEGYEVRTASGGAEGIAEYEKFRPQLVFLDVKMAGIDGLEVLKRIRQVDGNALVVMISGHATIQTAVEATQLGAYDILEKPLDTDRVLVLLRNALAAPLARARRTSGCAQTIESRYEIVGRSYAIRALLERIEKVAATPARVLITGENGTGKELVARAIHRRLAARQEAVRRGELRGHPVGAHRERAVRPHEGLVHRRHQRPRRQVRAGRRRHAVPRRDRRHVAGRAGQGAARAAGRRGHAHRRHQDRSQVDVRVLAATNKDLEAEIAAGRFREDLFYRLNVVPIAVPPLRERREDIELLVIALPAPVRRARRPAGARHHRRGAAPALRAGLAGQRARAAQHHGAAAHPRQRVHHLGRRRGAARRDAGRRSPRGWATWSIAPPSRSSSRRPSGRSCWPSCGRSTGTCRRRRGPSTCRDRISTRRSSVMV